MAARQSQYQESTAESTTTSGTYQDKVTLTFTPDASADYFFLWSALLSNNNSGVDAQVRLRDTTASFTHSELNLEAKELSAPIDYRCVFGLDKYTASASPVSTTWKVQYCADPGGLANTAGIKEARALAVKADAADQYAESEATSTTTNTSFQTKTTLTFTPGSQGDYLIIATAEVGTTAADQMEVKLDQGGTEYGKMYFQAKDTANFMPWGTAVKLNLAASSQSFTIQYRSGAGVANKTIQRARILALRLDAFESSQYAESRARSTTTSTTYQDKTTLTFTPSAVAYAMLGVGLLDGNSTTISNYAQFIEGATSLGEMPMENQSGSPTTQYAYFMLYKKTLSASSTTWKTQYKSETTSTTTGFGESAIAALQLDTAGGGGGATPTYGTLTMMGVG